MADDAGQLGPDRRRVVSDEEVRASFAGPTLHSNKFIASNLSYGLRLAFMEQMGTKVPPTFRTAVVLSYPDAIALKDLLTRQLLEIEPQVKRVEEEAKAKRAAVDPDAA